MFHGDLPGQLTTTRTLAIDHKSTRVRTVIGELELRIHFNCSAYQSTKKTQLVSYADYIYGGYYAACIKACCALYGLLLSGCSHIIKTLLKIRFNSHATQAF